MNTRQLLLAAALAGVAASVTAAPLEREKCYGIAQAGKNGCASANGTHSCSGQAKVDKDPGDWIYVAAGTCERMGGSIKPGK
jgi:uncharacterized membrane protein